MLANEEQSREITLRVFENVIDLARKENCSFEEIYKWEQTKKVLQYAKERYASEPEFLWERFPDCSAIRRSDNKKWYYFDLVSGEYEIRVGEPYLTGKLCVIGSNLNEENINALFFKE